MTNEELDRLWFEAMHQSIEANEDFVRYRFAALVAAEKERQMIRDGWRKCAEGQSTTQYCAVAEAALRYRDEP